jgi:hypothetical protein
VSDIVEQLRDARNRFIFQGDSNFALSLASEIERLRARVEELEGLARESLNALTFDRNGPHRNALRAALEAKP